METNPLSTAITMVCLIYDAVETKNSLIDGHKQSEQNQAHQSVEVIEGTPDLGITSYWTDADGNVVYSPNTPVEKMKSPVTGTKTQKRKDSVAKTLAMDKVEDKKEIQAQKDEEKVAVEASKSEQNEDAKEETAGQPVTSDQSEGPKQPADTVKEAEPQHEPQPETLSE